MDSTSSLTILALLLFVHTVVVVAFSKLIVGHEPSHYRRLVYFTLLLFIPFIGAGLIYKFLELNWFRNEDGSKRSGAVSIDFLEMDAIFNPGSKQIMEERQRVKTQVRKEGEDFDRS